MKKMLVRFIFGVGVKVLKIPYKILFPLIVLFCSIGAYSVASSVADIIIMPFS